MLYTCITNKVVGPGRTELRLKERAARSKSSLVMGTNILGLGSLKGSAGKGTKRWRARCEEYNKGPKGGGLYDVPKGAS